MYCIVCPVICHEPLGTDLIVVSFVLRAYWDDFYRETAYVVTYYQMLSNGGRNYEYPWQH